MIVTNLTSLIVCLIAPLLVASRQITARGMVGWFFLTALGAIVAMAIGMGIGMGIAGANLTLVASGANLDAGTQATIDTAGLLGSMGGTALMFYFGNQKSRMQASKLNPK